MTLEFIFCLVFMGALFIGYVVIDTVMEREQKEKERQEIIDLAVEIAKEIKEQN